MVVVAVVVAALLAGAGAAVTVLFAARGTPAAQVQTPVGSSGEGYAVWARNGDGTAVRWDPCAPIEIVVSETGLPLSYPVEEHVADVTRAAATLAEATGLDLVVRERTDEVPSADRSTIVDAPEGTPRWAPVLVGWRPPGEGGLPLRDVDRGVAVPVAVGPEGAQVYVTGQVVLNPLREDLLPGTGSRSDSWGATILHELAHVLGLDHVDDPGELMHVYPGSGRVELGPGDLAGLAAVGADAGDGACLDVPPPRELEVDVPTS